MNASTFDVIVVGSGAGGAAATYRLVKSGLKVLLLEKGVELPRDGSTLDIVRVVHRGEFLSREPWQDGRGAALTPEEHFNLGGKTKWYGAALLRFAPWEFESDPAHQCRPWPIPYSSLEPYYQQAEKLLGVREIPCERDLARILARIPSAAGWHSLPLPMCLAREIDAYPQEARHFDGFASPRDLKADAEVSLLKEAARLPGLRTIAASEVVALVGAAQDPRRVIGVRCRDGSEFTAREVVLAAGALHSPRILERYLAATGLVRELPAARHVGRHLKLHLLTAMVAVGLPRRTDLIRKTTLLVHERFAHSSVQPLGFDGELIATLMPKFLPAVIARQMGERAYGFFLQTEDGSSAQNRVVDAVSGPPVLDYDETRVAAARREHRAFAHALQRVLLRAGMVAFTRRIGLNGTAHVCGTLAAGADPLESVVDAAGRVHGMQGLRVADGSVLPRSSRVNPSLTIYAWGLRVGELLASELTTRAAAGERLRGELQHVV
jgi:choline dehydrogenase-like flavoprotein